MSMPKDYMDEVQEIINLDSLEINFVLLRKHIDDRKCLHPIMIFKKIYSNFFHCRRYYLMMRSFIQCSV